MAETAPVGRRHREALGGQLAARQHVPQAELAHHPPVRRPCGPADHHRLGVDHAPVLEARGRVEVARAVDEGGAIERLEQPRALQVGRHHVRHLERELRLLAHELRHGDGDGLQGALGDVDLQRAALGRPRRLSLGAGGRARSGRGLLRLAVGAGLGQEQGSQQKAGNSPQDGPQAGSETRFGPGGRRSCRIDHGLCGEWSGAPSRRAIVPFRG